MRTTRFVSLGLVCLLGSTVAIGACGDDDDNPGSPDSGIDSPVTPPVDGGTDTGSDTGLPDADAGVVVAKGSTNGSSVALSADESRLVVCNRDKGSVSIFSITYTTGAPPTVTKVAEVDLGAGSEPWQVAISPAGDAAFVVLRQAQKVTRINGINTAAPAKGLEAATGSEPTAIALTPTGARAWIANWVDGTLTGIDTATMAVAKTVNLNTSIAPLLGTGLTARPAMAHPRSIAITNNGNTDDSDETMFVTEYFGVRKDAETGTGQANNADTSKQGVVYSVKLSNDAVTNVTLAPLADMGFLPAAGGSAGCYPNQLQSISISGKYAYVVGICASPKGPLGLRDIKVAGVDVVCTPGDNTPCANVGDNPGASLEGTCVADPPPAVGTGKCKDLATFKTTTAPLLAVIDTTTNTEVASSRTNLNKRWFDRYAAANPAVPNDAARRLPLVANDLSFVPQSAIGYISANGTDAVFRVAFDANGGISEIGSPAQHFIDLRPTGIAAEKQGALPTGIATGSKGFAFVANDTSRNVSVLDLALQTVAGGAAAAVVVDSTAKPTAGSPEEAVLKGRRFFNTGLGRWSLRGQGWGACQSCHMDGLTDNVTWYFGRGPRQSTSLDGSFSKDGNTQRLFNWNAIFDDVADFEGNTRGTSGGVGAIVKATSTPAANADRIDLATFVTAQRHDGLNGSAKLAADAVSDQFGVGAGNRSLLNDWAEIEAYMKTIRAPRGAKSIDAAKVTTGRQLFIDNNCGGCHGGVLWTTSTLFYTRVGGDAFTVTQGLSGKNFSAMPTNFSPTGAATGAMRVAANTGNDSLLCALRNVGTFETAEAAVGTANKIPELRQDMTTAAQGGAAGIVGYSPPSLLGVSIGAPFLHGGNARTLEALFSTTFDGHHRSISTNFLQTPATAAAEREALIHFLLSLDDDTTVVAPPAVAGAQGGVFCNNN